MALRAILAAALLAAPAAAETITEETDRLAVRIAHDDRVAAEPEFDGFLRADARDVVAEFRLGAAEADGRPWRVEVVDEVTHFDERWISLKRVTRFDTGGAHGNAYVDAFTWDRRADDFVRLDAFLKGAEDGFEGFARISDALRARIATQYYGGRVDDANRADVAMATTPDPASLRNFTLAQGPGGRAIALDFHYAPYEIGPYAFGSPTIRIPREVFAAHLSDDGAAVFAPKPRTDCSAG